MNIIIIEDEELVAEDLQTTIQKLSAEFRILKILHSVKQAVDYFSQTNAHADLIFSDIQLGDGLSFEIFKKGNIALPIVFCTAFDNYALEAFQSTGIDYILKPYHPNDIQKSLQKYVTLKNTISNSSQKQAKKLEQTLQLLEQKKSGTLMIKYRERYLPIGIEQIALAYLENEVNHLVLFSGKVYFLQETLEEIQKKLGSNFFRVNRQFLVHRKAIREAKEYFPRKLILDLHLVFSKQILVSKEKKTKFLDWLG